jgi:hypothetical protein
MADLFVYRPDSVVCLVAGMLAVEGFVDGSFLSIEKVADPFKSVTTPDGTTARIHNQDASYNINITLHTGSSSNDFLTKLWLLDEVSERGKFPLLIKDGSGSDLFFSTSTWIEKIPSIVKSNDVDARIWTLKSAYAVVNVGSNADEASLVSDLLSIATSALPSLSNLF